MKSVRAHGKCILVGEHAVVRGAPALVFPLKSRGLTLLWEHDSSAPDRIEIREDALGEAFRAALTRGLGSAKLKKGAWKFDLASDIPLQAGLGSSAALSVAIARFLVSENLTNQELFPLALGMENLFHGTSSGIDVAAALADGPIRFEKGKAPRALETKWHPELRLHDTGLRSSTKDCVAKVARLESRELDDRMARAVLQAEKALLEAKLAELAEAMEEASACFCEWGLIPREVAALMEELKRRGALAVKPTGSGDGGYVLSLWRDDARDGIRV